MCIVTLCPGELKEFYAMVIFLRDINCHFSFSFDEICPAVFKFSKSRFGTSDLRAINEFVTL